MRIVIDVQTLFTNERFRGIGIYTFNWLLSILNDRNNRYYLIKYKNSKWYFTIFSSSRSLESILDNEFLWEEAEPNEFLTNNKINLVMYTSPLMFDIKIPNIKGDYKIGYIVYDLIPLVLKDNYFNKWSDDIKRIYMERLEKIKCADVILTISEATKRDIVQKLKVNEDIIKVIYASTKENIFNLKDKSEAKDYIRKNLKISDSFIFSVTGDDLRKNSRGIINSFRLILDKLPSYKLIIAGILSKNERDLLYDYVKSINIPEGKVYLLDYISDELLANLYAASELFIFPSLYEGFGLPVLEALRSGTPVITSNISSLPEIVGEAGITVDPNNFEEISQRAIDILTDKQLSDKLIDNAKKQAGKFTWANVGKISIKSFNDLFAREHSCVPVSTANTNLKPKLAFLSPLNPQPSGISDYCEELLLYLKEYFDICLFVDGFEPSNEILKNNFKIYDLMTQKSMLEHFKYRLYNMGNNVLHYGIYKTLKEYPGITVLHDYNLFGFMTHTMYHKGNKSEFYNLIKYCNGEEGEKVVEEIEKNNMFPDCLDFPLNRMVLDLSNGVIVHSEWARDEIIKSGYLNSVRKISLASPLYKISKSEIESIKKELKLSEYEVIIGVFGNVIPNKRIDVVLSVFSKLIKTNESALLLISGHCEESYKKTLMEKANDYRIFNNIIITGGVEFALLEKYMKACDICINLRWPTMGETSASLNRALGMGKPCIVSNVNQYKEYPDSCCWKVDVDIYEEELLLSYLIELCNNRSLRVSMGNSAYEYINKYCSFERVAKDYYEYILSV